LIPSLYWGKVGVDAVMAIMLKWVVRPSCSSAIELMDKVGALATALETAAPHFIKEGVWIEN